MIEDKQPEEKWYRSQDWISDQDKRISKLTHQKDKKNVRWMGFSIVFEQDGAGNLKPRPERFPIPARDFQDAVNKFQKAYEDHVATLNQEQNEMEEKRPKIVVPDAPHIIGG